MRKMSISMACAALAAAALLMSGAELLAGDGIAINITNDGTQDILVTVYDTSVRPHAAVLRNARINGFTTIPLSVSPDATGRANLAWSAVSVDPNDRKCGHDVKNGLSDSASVHVHADGSCTPDQ